MRFPLELEFMSTRSVYMQPRTRSCGYVQAPTAYCHFS